MRKMWPTVLLLAIVVLLAFIVNWMVVNHVYIDAN